MNARVKKSWSHFILLIVLSFFVAASSLFALPAGKKQTAKSSPSRAAQNVPARPIPLVVDDDAMRTSKSGLPAPAPVPQYLGPRAVETAASPFVDVRVGIPETPGGNNHMRRQVALSPNGTVHMVYGVISGWTAADSATNFFYFYNAYNCSGSGALEFGSMDVPMTAPGPPADPRPRYMNQGGLFIQHGSTIPIVYGNRYILRTETDPAQDVSRRGGAVMRDSAECLGMFSMDTTLVPNNVPPIAVHWVMYPLNESTWIATCRPSSNPSDVGWTYTTDRGLSWTAVAILQITSPWFNSVDITGSGNTFYIVAVGDPQGPIECFTTCQRPIYQKGIYNPATGEISFGVVTDIIGDYELPGFMPNMLGVSALMISDTLHVIWTDWNNWEGNGFDGPGGHVHHAAVQPNGIVQGPHKIADIKIDGRLPIRSVCSPTWGCFGFTIEPWPYVSLTYNPNTGILYGLWSQPPDDSNFGWGDYEQYNALACYDIFCAASPNNGRAWDDPQNVTQTNNPGCDGSPQNPCHHEDWFSTAELADSVINVVAMVQRYPGFQETYIRSGITPDPGPLTELKDVFRLYRVPARTPVPTIRAVLAVSASDTTKLETVSLRPRDGITSVNMRLSNFGIGNFYLDSAKLTGTLNDGFLVTSTNAVPGTYIPSSENYGFNLTFNPSGVGPADQGLRSGYLRVFVHTDDVGVPPGEEFKTLYLPINAYVVINLCLNRKIQIHSGKNYTDIGVQGSIKDRAGYGMYYPVTGHDNFYDGGMFIGNSSLIAEDICGQPRKVSQQFWNDKYLRCLADGILDSIQGTGSYYNLFLKSIGADINDSGLAWQNIWEQSTHPDSSDFLIQTARVINIGGSSIDSVAMGVRYDVDVDVEGVSYSLLNVAGDTTVTHLGRTWWLGWFADNDVLIDSCSPGSYFYGVVVVPGSIGNPGDTVRPRGATLHKQVGFNNDPCITMDSVFQRYAYNLDVLASPRDRQYDSLTGTFGDTSATCIANNTCKICGGPGAYSTGPPYHFDLAYLAIAKKVYNLPVNGGGQNTVARYGLDGLAASIDTFFSGPGETYTVIHVASSGGGLSGLMANAVKGIDWYTNHAGSHVGPVQTWRKGDLNNDGLITPSDIVEELQYVFLGDDVSRGNAIPFCTADLNNSGDLTPADVIDVLQGAFAGGGGCPNCLRPCL